MEDYLYEEDVPKYRKKTNSAKSKAREKTKHKHEYVDCLVKVENVSLCIYVGKYCKTCGKVGPMHIETDRLPDGGYVMVDKEEVLKRHKKFPIITLSSFDQKYVPITIKHE